MPVIVRERTFIGKTQSELSYLVRLLTLMADYFNKEEGCGFPVKTGTFTETETEFVLAGPAVPEGALRYDNLRLPRTTFFPEPK